MAYVCPCQYDGTTADDTSKDTSTDTSGSTEYNMATLRGKINGVAAVITEKVLSDDASVDVDEDGTLRLHGFYDAPASAIPYKDGKGKLCWIVPAVSFEEFSDFISGLHVRLSVDEEALQGLKQVDNETFDKIKALTDRVSLLEQSNDVTTSPLKLYIDALGADVNAARANINALNSQLTTIQSSILVATSTANNAMTAALDAKSNMTVAVEKAERAADSAQEAWQAVRRMEADYTAVVSYDSTDELPDVGSAPCIYIVGNTEIYVWDEDNHKYVKPGASVELGTLYCGDAFTTE